MTDAKRILFVDDEPGIRATLPIILRGEGFDVSVAASVSEAVELIKNKTFDVLISDLNIGEPGDGFTVVSVMRRLQPDVVTFILTGFPDFESALRAIRSQVDDYLVKPAAIAELVGLVKERISNRKPRRAIRIERVCDFVPSHANQILEQWLHEVEKDERLAKLPLNRRERLHNIGEILAAICEQLNKDGRQLSERTRRAAAEQGEVRFRQSYTPELIVLEQRILQRCIADTLQAHLLALDVSTLLADVLNLGDQFGLYTEEAIRVFRHAQFDVA